MITKTRELDLMRHWQNHKNDKNDYNSIYEI